MKNKCIYDPKNVELYGLLRKRESVQLTELRGKYTAYSKWQRIDFPGTFEERGSPITHNQPKNIC